MERFRKLALPSLLKHYQGSKEPKFCRINIVYFDQLILGRSVYLYCWDKLSRCLGTEKPPNVFSSWKALCGHPILIYWKSPCVSTKYAKQNSIVPNYGKMSINQWLLNYLAGFLVNFWFGTLQCLDFWNNFYIQNCHWVIFRFHRKTITLYTRLSQRINTVPKINKITNFECYLSILLKYINWTIFFFFLLQTKEKSTFLSAIFTQYKDKCESKLKMWI